jgi:isocitrate dehydrogenase (NAD+)
MTVCTSKTAPLRERAIPDGRSGGNQEMQRSAEGAPPRLPERVTNGANVKSANVAMRKESGPLCQRKAVKVPSLGFDWTFFRENTECLYALGSQGVNINEDLAFDFRVITNPGTERIARLAFEYARANGKKRVTIVTKANVVKTTDGKFLDVCKQVAKDYPDIETDDWYIDIMTAKLIDEKRRGQFEVLILPNLYGDILTDEAAEFQGGVGTAGSANLGRHYSMFEAIHGSAPRMVEEGRDIYADPSSVIRAGAMLLSHIGYQEKANRLFAALEECTVTEKKLTITGRPDGATGAQFADYILSKI